jgi:deazaflavin-dependent oxidoreductase (nitroreductase family)
MEDREAFNRQLIEDFRNNRGQLSSHFTDVLTTEAKASEVPVLLLTSIGAKSGRSLTTPVAYTCDGDRLVLIASKGGAPTNPAWYHNLVAHPEATIEVGAEQWRVKASLTAGAERERLFRQHAERLPAFADFEKKTTRHIPVFILERI